VDLFTKCDDLGLAGRVLDAGIRPWYRELSSGPDAEAIVEGRPTLMFGSNNYLGLGSHPRVKAAAAAAVEQYGVGCGGSRVLSGTLDVHVDLERRMARFLRRDDCLFYSSGYLANLGVISTLATKDDVVVVDKKAHASILDGARFSAAEVRRFRHNDPADLEEVLAECGDRGKLVCIDGVYSMEGDIAPLPRIVSACRKHGARLLLDDAHGIGVLGENGRGTAEHFGLEHEVDLVLGAASKSLPAVGGFIAGDQRVIKFLRWTTTNRPSMFTAAMTPATAAAIREALAIIEEQPALRRKLWAHTRRAHHALRAMGYDTGHSQTPIIPVTSGTMDRTFAMWQLLKEEGIFVNVVGPPAVPPGRCVIRISLMASHSPEQIDRLLEAMRRIGTQLGVIGGEERKAG
jgi:8-amino-7-oxononanoate synthase